MPNAGECPRRPPLHVPTTLVSLCCAHCAYYRLPEECPLLEGAHYGSVPPMASLTCAHYGSVLPTASLFAHDGSWPRWAPIRVGLPDVLPNLLPYVATICRGLLCCGLVGGSTDRCRRRNRPCRQRKLRSETSGLPPTPFPARSTSLARSRGK